MVVLTPEQHDEISRVEGPIQVVDPATGREYVLISSEAFRRMYCVIDDQDDISSWYPLMDEVAKREGWGDDEPDLYGDLDPRRPS